MFTSKKLSNLSNLQRRSDSVLDGFRTALVNYNKITDEIQKESYNLQKEIEERNKELNHLNQLNDINSKYINKLNDFLTV